MNIIAEIDAKIKTLQMQKAEIQEKCNHPYKTSEYKSNTGNYDPSADCYWVTHHCQLCDKRWTEDQ